jgi:Arc/MetJ-type ribon-helix-helix transcriptional regulator
MADTEKITLNMSVVDLGQIDLLVSEGYFSSRTDCIRTAIRNLLSEHAGQVKATVERRSFVIGALIYSRADLEEKRLKGIRLNIKVLGLFSLAGDVSPELARATIESIEVHGAFKASEEVKQALADRITS